MNAYRNRNDVSMLRLSYSPEPDIDYESIEEPAEAQKGDFNLREQRILLEIFESKNDNSTLLHKVKVWNYNFRNRPRTSQQLQDEYSRVVQNAVMLTELDERIRKIRTRWPPAQDKIILTIHEQTPDMAPDEIRKEFNRRNNHENQDSTRLPLFFSTVLLGFRYKELMSIGWTVELLERTALQEQEAANRDNDQIEA